MKKILFIFTFSLVSFVSFSQQAKLKKADSYFNRLAYAYAADIYEDLLGSKVDNAKMQLQLATCYYHMGDMLNAEKFFATPIKEGNASKENIFHYAQALKQNGKYAESDLWMQAFSNNYKTDLRSNSFVNNPSYIEKIKKDGNRFEIKLVSTNTSSADFGAYPSIDEKQIYFVSARNSSSSVKRIWAWNESLYLDLYSSKVDEKNDLNTPLLITKRINTNYHEGPLVFFKDGKKVFFTRNNIAKGKERRDDKGIQNLKIYIADIDAGGKWTNERELLINSKDYSVGHPTLSPDNKFLYFASDMPNGIGGVDLYKMEIMEDGTFGKPINLGKDINTEGDEMFPWVDELGQLFFSSNGHIGLGGLDVFVSFPTKEGSFKNLMNVGIPVNSQRDDFAFVLLKDGSHGYFSSNREGGKGDDDIYSFLLTKPFMKSLTLEGVVVDKDSRKILPNALIQLTNEAGEVIASSQTDASGKYQFDLDPEIEANYTVSYQKDSFSREVRTFSTVNRNPDVENINVDIELEKEPEFGLLTIVTDKNTKQGIEGVRIRIIDNSNGAEIANVLSSSTGDFKMPLPDRKIGDKLNLTMVVDKEGYLAKKLAYSTTLVKPGIIELNQTLNLELDKLEAGFDLAKIIDIKPIYFDLNKYNIRKDAAIELDKIVKVMNDYPEMVIELGSHTDCRSSYAYNEKLSDNRAKASAAYIKARISKPERIYGKGYGEYKLKNDCACEGPVKSTCSELEHQENRRTEFIVQKVGVSNVTVTGGSAAPIKK